VTECIPSNITTAAIEFRAERSRREHQGERRSAAAAGGSLSNDIVTEDNVARRFAELYEGALRFCHDTGAWFKFDGNLWQQNRTGLAFQWARELARHLSKDKPDKTRFITSKTSFAAGVERFARNDPVFATTIEFWDQDLFLLGTPEGTVDLKSGELREGRPEDGTTKSTAVAPADVAGCPLWLRFLEETTGSDAEMIRFLQQWCGYALTGDVREHALVFVFGAGGNGKSVFVNVVTGILASYATVATMETFIAARGERHTTDIAMLRGARLVTASETEEGRPWAEARIKQLTGGDAITARFMNKNNFTFKPCFKLTIVGNHKPVLHNVDEAQRRRFNLVPFVRTPANPDRELEQKLKAEWPAILRWMIDGCCDWQANGLVRPASVVDATAEYFADQDLFAQWLEEECDAEPGNTWKMAPGGELFKSWTSYSLRAGEKPGSQKSFSETMGKRGFHRKRGTGGTRLFVGLRLKEANKYADRDERSDTSDG
jgi:putative DNA primase/helicase